MSDEHDTRAEPGHCELCSKALADPDAKLPVQVRDALYEYCCHTCAGAVSAHETTSASAPTHSETRPITVSDRLGYLGVLPWLEEAVKEQASDLFVSVGEAPRLKVFGSFRHLGETPLTDLRVLEVAEAVIPEAKRAQFADGRDVDLGLTVAGAGRFRVNVFRELRGPAIAFRPLPDRIPTLDDLLLPPILTELTRQIHGLVLVTGPTGSGKTTTLAAFIDTINRRDERHILTIEDPVEYVVPNRRSLIHQREVGLHTPSFADGLRSALREAPDIIVVGELRDLESISLAIRAAETGHLVLGTLHSGTAIQSVTRLLDVFEAGLQNQIRVQLSQSLRAIMSQRLLRRRDRPGMAAATEMLIATPAVRNIIRQGKVQELHTYLETGLRDGMHTMAHSVQALVARGMVDADASKHLSLALD